MHHIVWYHATPYPTVQCWLAAGTS